MGFYANLASRGLSGTDGFAILSNDDSEICDHHFRYKSVMKRLVGRGALSASLPDHGAGLIVFVIANLLLSEQPFNLSAVARWRKFFSRNLVIAFINYQQFLLCSPLGFQKVQSRLLISPAA